MPETAVVHEGDKTSVFIQNASGKYDQRAVTIGRTFITGANKTVEVLSGIKDGEKVVTAGGALLRPTTGD